MVVIGLTGGIASGKSLAASVLSGLGAAVIDADKVGHEIIAPGTRAYAELIGHFGERILREDGHIDRKKLGEIIFSDAEERKVLNRITHPRILEQTASLLEEIESKNSQSVAVIEAALLIEMGLQEYVDEVWVVVTDEEKQIERLRERSGLKYEEAVNRIRSQLSQEEKAANADKVLYNTRDEEFLRRQVVSLWYSLSTS